MKSYVLPLLAAMAFVQCPLAYGQGKITQPEVSEKACPLEIVSVERDGLKPFAVVRKPPGKGPFPLLIYIHGGTAPRRQKSLMEESRGNVTLCRFLQAGYVVANATYTQRPEGKRLHSKMREALKDCVALMAGLKKMPEVDPKSVLVLGSSGGGNLALELADQTELCAVVGAEPATIILAGLDRSAMANPKQAYDAQAQKITRDKIARIRCPILIVHGDVHEINKFNNDVYIPELKAAGKKVEVIYYPGAPHALALGRNTAPETTKKVFDDCNAFFMRHLPTQPRPVEKSLVREVPVSGK
jgi:dienelactone hydrolase